MNAGRHHGRTPLMNQPAAALFQDHPRSFEANRYVYPVLSRRSRGISIGVNLNVDKVCNFHCVYCQVSRGEPIEKQFVDLPRLRDELDRMIDLVVSGRIFAETPFRRTPEPLRRLNDVALSGDGEPTTYTNFADVVSLCAEVRQQHKLDQLKLVLITNASMFHREPVARALEVLDANNGEIWAKLDAGTEAYYREVARSGVASSRFWITCSWRPVPGRSSFNRSSCGCASSRRLRPSKRRIAAACVRSPPAGAASSWCRFTPLPGRRQNPGLPASPTKRSTPWPSGSACGPACRCPRSTGPERVGWVEHL